MVLGVMRRLTVFLLYLLQIPMLASSNYPRLFNSIEIETDLKPVLGTTRARVERNQTAPFAISRISIWINGTEHRVSHALMKATDGALLNQVSLGTYSVLCIVTDPNCTPGAYLEIPFGDFIQEECEYSTLTVSFGSSGIDSVSSWRCLPDGTEEEIGYIEYDA